MVLGQHQKKNKNTLQIETEFEESEKNGTELLYFKYKCRSREIF